MWLGHNCQMIADNSTVQKVKYLPPINAFPVTYDVVYETLDYALSIAQKCNQQKIIVTYDLAIAKMALQIQSQEKPLYDDIFVNLGGFHMQMAFFKVIGKYIDSSGLVDILINADVLAMGSVNSLASISIVVGAFIPCLVLLFKCSILNVSSPSVTLTLMSFATNLSI